MTATQMALDTGPRLNSAALVCAHAAGASGIAAAVEWVQRLADLTAAVTDQAPRAVLATADARVTTAGARLGAAAWEPVPLDALAAVTVDELEEAWAAHDASGPCDCGAGGDR